MKTLKQFIYEDNNISEVYEIFNEILNNDVTNEEIEESFNYYNLILEKLNVDEIKEHQKKYLDWLKKVDEETINNIKEDEKRLDSIKKKISKLTKQLSNIEIGSNEYKDILSEINKENKNFEKIKSEYTKHLNDRLNRGEYMPENNDDAKLGYFFDIFLAINRRIKWCINENNKLKKNAEKNIKSNSILLFYSCDNSYNDHVEIYEKLNKKLKEEKKKDKEIYETIILYLHDCVEALDMKDLYDINENDGVKVKTENVNNFILKSTFGITTDKDKINSIYFNHENKTFEAVDTFENALKMLDNGGNTSKKDNENKSEPSKEIQSEEEQKEQTTEVISDNKELLAPIAKEAKVTGEQLRDIITKICVDKKGKSRKLDEGVILGISIMICGALLTVKKNGKKDNSAIKSVVEKITKIIANKKSIDSIIK
jgi:hypothetical protein